MGDVVSYLNLPGVVFVADEFMTFAQLLANYPPSAQTRGRYAKVTDLYGSQAGAMVCGYDSNHTLNGGYFWQPVRPDSTNAAPLPSNTAAVITPITMPSFIRFTNAALTANVTHTLSSTNAYPGCRIRMLMPGLLGLFGITLTGTLGSGVVGSLLQNTPREFMWDGAAWQNYQ